MENPKTSKTHVLNEKLKQNISITELFEENSKDFLEIPLCDYLKAIIEEKEYTKAHIIRESGIQRRYFFDILSGKRRPTRDYILRIVHSLEMPIEDVQWLLKATGYAQLYSRDKRDSVIIFCINHNHSVIECNKMLSKINLHQI